MNVDKRIIFEAELPFFHSTQKYNELNLSSLFLKALKTIFTVLHLGSLHCDPRGNDKLIT